MRRTFWTHSSGVHAKSVLFRACSRQVSSLLPAGFDFVDRGPAEFESHSEAISWHQGRCLKTSCGSAGVKGGANCPLSLLRLAAARIACLVGPAGAGKTTVLEVLLDRPEIVGRRVLLLAPTGKARARLGIKTNRPGEAKTIAQFLLPLERFDPNSGRYALADAAGVDPSCCVMGAELTRTDSSQAALISVR